MNWQSTNKAQSKAPQQNFYPMVMLPTFIANIDQLVDPCEEQLRAFLLAKENPGSLNDDQLKRAISALTESSEYLFVCGEQLHKWKREAVTNAQKKSLDVFAQKISQARDLYTKLMNIATELQEITIEKILEKNNSKDND